MRMITLISLMSAIMLQGGVAAINNALSGCANGAAGSSGDATYDAFNGAAAADAAEGNNNGVGELPSMLKDDEDAATGLTASTTGNL